MRALLVVNEQASRTTPAVADSVQRVLSESLEVHIAAWTPDMDFAAGYDAVAVLGGDGTVNHVANRLIESASTAALAPLPGGHANVIARNLGLPRETGAAARAVTHRLTEGRMRRMCAGRVTAAGIDRWFLANTGVGADASVLQRMNTHRAGGRPATDYAYLRFAIRELAGLTLRGSGSGVEIEAPGHTAVRAPFALVANLSPWTYLAGRPVDPHPRAGHEDSLAAYAPLNGSPVTLTRMAVRMLSGGDLARLPGVWAHTVDSLTLATDAPMWLQTDGEVLGEVTHAHVTHWPGALTVVQGTC